MPSRIRPIARPSQTPQARPELSLSEVAFVAGTTTREVNVVVDEQEIELLPSTRRGAGMERRERVLGAIAVAYLAVRRRYHEVLTRAGRRELYAALSRLPDTWQTLLTPPEPRRLELASGITLPLEPMWGELVERVRLLESAYMAVESTSQINGGDPVVRGTRVSVAVLADLRRQGATDAELLEDFPSLTPDSLRAALRYAALHPRRGRPPGTLGPRRPDVA